MPHVHVPLAQQQLSRDARTVKISYTICGRGPILVLLVPGLCVPGSMYDSIAGLLASTSQFTAVAIDNRGVGDSGTPYASFLHAPGYTAQQLAHDAWAVIDHARGSLPHLSKHVALIGHSMGGMVVQNMVAMHPRLVKFVALLSTHAGGYWNLLPSWRMIRSAFKVVFSGFDRNVHASVNLDMHFTKKFLDDSISAEDLSEFCCSDAMNSNESVLSDDSSASHPPHNGLLQSRSPSQRQASVPETIPSQESSESLASLLPRSFCFPGGLSFVESKLIDFARDANVFFGLSVSSLHNKLRHPKQFLLDALANRAHWRHPLPRFRRWDIYHARYTGADSNVHDSQSKSLSDGRSQSAPSPESYTYFGHVAVVWSHSLSNQSSWALRQCSGIVKLVVIGRHDQVITPSSSRALASAINANTVIEVDAAHFVTDEASSEITTHLIYGLRKAFFTPSLAQNCSCEWCTQDIQFDAGKLS